MNIIIKKLTPQLAEDYVHFFDVTPHNFNGEKCYCVTWRNDKAYEAYGSPWFSTQEERRARAIQFVREGGIQGYLAYDGDEVVGWCNANTDCSFCVDYLRSYYPIEEVDAACKVKWIFCFAIAPKMQRMGIATKLLERVCQDAKADGFDFVEAAVNQEFTETDSEFRGPLTMYEKCGFYRCAVRDGKVVVRKALQS